LAAFTFTEPEPARYPNLYLAIDACAAGQGATTALNAANEAAVAAFLQGQLAFNRISEVNQRCLAEFAHYDAQCLDAILAVDQQSRAFARALIGKF